MNAVLEQIVETGHSSTPSGESIDVRYAAIPPQEGVFLQQLVRRCAATVTLEVGLANGISALHICEALEKGPHTKHIVIDPYQYKGLDSQTWHGVGMHNLQKAGYEPFVEYHGLPSHQVLPQLEKEGRRIDFAFIDGCHTFDYAFVDFFYIDKMLEVGGIVALDDANMPSIRKLCRYIATNLSYRVVADPNQEDDKERMSRRVIEEVLAVPVFTNLKKKVFKVELVDRDASLGLRGRCVAFQKTSEDDREWTYHAAF